MFFFTTLVVVAVDQLSKLGIRSILLPGQSLPQEGILRLTYLTNTGGIFGLFAGQYLLLVFCSLAVILALFFYYRHLRFDHPLIKIALGLMLGGGISNLVDRLCFGCVTDFIDIRIYGNFHWAAFNLADFSIVAGGCIIAYFLLLRKWKRQLL